MAVGATYSPDGRYYWDGERWLDVPRPALRLKVGEFTNVGFRVVREGATEVDLVRRKRFDSGIALLSFLVLGVGFFVYLFYYLAQPDEYVTVYEVNGEALVRRSWG